LRLGPIPEKKREGRGKKTSLFMDKPAPKVETAQARDLYTGQGQSIRRNGIYSVKKHYLYDYKGEGKRAG